MKLSAITPPPAAPAAPAATAPTGNAAVDEGYGRTGDVVGKLSVPGSHGDKARTDLPVGEIRSALASARDAASLLKEGSETAENHWLGRNAGFALEHVNEGIQHLTWLEDVIGNFKEPTQAMIDMKFEDAHGSFVQAMSTYGLE